MTTRSGIAASASLLLVLLLLPGCEPPTPAPQGQEPNPSSSTAASEGRSLEVHDAVFSFTPGMGALYFRISNPTDRADRLVSVSTAVAESAEIHETVVEGDVVTMKAHPAGLEIPAGETVILEPGGKHVMLMGLSFPDEVPPDQLDLRLVFESRGSVEVVAVPMAPHSSASHAEHAP